MRSSDSPDEDVRGRGRARLTAVVAAVVLAVGGGAVAAPPATADTAPPPGVAETVSADPLPTAQIDGVAWGQAIASGRVWVGGEFSRARPAGSAPGANTSPRANLMAYTLQTGVMTAWNPGANGMVKTVAASPDGTRVYIGGSFTSVAGQPRNRVAAFDALTGALLPWAPSVNSTVSGLAVHGDTVYVVGSFTNVAGSARTRLAAVRASTGAVLPLTASLTGGYGVSAVVVDPTGAKIVVAGSFERANGSTDPGRGMAALDATTGASLPWAINSLIRNGGTNASINSLTSDEDSVYGTAYDYYGTDEDGFEGTFRARWSDGALVWLEDCHGDNYSVAVSSGVVYTAGHDHYCGNVGGFPQTVPNWTFRHSLAFDKQHRGRLLTPDIYGYSSYGGRPAGETLHWYPNWQVGTYTGKSQAVWDVEANADYVLYGGEFPQVNGVAQQGLVRFAKRAIAPNQSGPERSGANFAVSAVSLRAGQVRLTWTANPDRDNQTLTYDVLRQDRGSTPVCTQTADSNFWTMPILSCVDATATAGTAYQYRVRARDPLGNEALGSWVPVTTATGDRVSAYGLGVLDDGAVRYWPLDETSGTAAADIIGGSPMTVASATRGVVGPYPATIPRGTQFTGNAGSYAHTPANMSGPSTFSVEAWFRTSSNRGGKVVSFGNRNTVNSTMHDRMVYLDNQGRVTFGVNSGGLRTISTGTGFNDGRWHHVVGTVSASGMSFYVDGVRIGTRADATGGQNYTGFWRVGGDTAGSWPNVGSSGYLNGAVAHVAVYPTALSETQARTHFQRAAGAAPPVNTPPVARFTSQTNALAVTVDGTTSSDPDGSIASYAWTFGDGGTATGPTASRTYAAPGTYTVGLTVTDDRGATHQASAQVTVSSPPVVPGAIATDPFDRTVTGGWGAADVGGTWTLTGPAAAYSVGSSAGAMRHTSSTGLQTTLSGVMTADARVSTAFAVDKIANAHYVMVIGRQVGADQYQMRIRVGGDGSVQLLPMRGSSAIGGSVTVPGVVLVPGATYRASFQVSGTSPTTLSGKLWRDGDPEPAWQFTRTDATPAMQAPGRIGLSSFVPTVAGAYPLVVSVHEFRAVAP